MREVGCCLEVAECCTRLESVSRCRWGRPRLVPNSLSLSVRLRFVFCRVARYFNRCTSVPARSVRKLVPEGCARRIAGKGRARRKNRRAEVTKFWNRGHFLFVESSPSRQTRFALALEALAGVPHATVGVLANGIEQNRAQQARKAGLAATSGRVAALPCSGSRQEIAKRKLRKERAPRRKSQSGVERTRISGHPATTLLLGHILLRHLQKA